ncbi:serine/threonine-protein kinase [Gluconobacter kanchanaburiensis]|uniref:Protein kinase domain-containing protein n=1 Tax=Gluconobacter kanchanaburiensis NBRC 103587 TaxID=1307948 RepID=A0A511B9Q7_9PROT|nr:hypothetical protein [Gluconobacter kanchanaburiensis]MBF0862906.1 hypothetical protein [Gluconobacter kanchanaburiensis]GBR72039.1 hypothetical protein AA103587_2667 [Gluconobacter kanchanaburiensis NBRC 103587]GEK97168.1 hypothetical protein GKA01_23650 [Gluconobacter kanchanaburiensis NBRC 103587]
MADTQADNSQELLIAERYLISLDHKQPDLAGCATYTAQDMTAAGNSYLALAPVAPSARLSEIMFFRHESVIPIQAHEYSAGALWILCPHPPGPSLAEGLGLWTESQLIDGVIRPFASLFQSLEAARLTCRNIRPDNLFVGQGLHKIVLGPLGVGAPAENQAVVFEPLSSAVCRPSARGDGTIDDDIFSLGVMILALAIGKLPLEGLSDTDILRRRFEVGTPAAYMEGQNVPVGLRSLLTAMLADDPVNRPSPRDLVTIAPSKLFTVRSILPARVPLMIGGNAVYTPQALAWYAGRHPTEFSGLLQRKVVSNWLHSELELSVMASLIEQASASFLPAGGGKAVDPATMVLTHAISVLDPAAPMFWGGIWFWPEALPRMVAQAVVQPATPDEERTIRNILNFMAGNPDAFVSAHLPRRQGQQITALSVVARRAGAKGLELVRRLPYDTNSFLPCLSKRCWEERISLPDGLSQWLDRHAGIEDLPEDVLGRSGFLDDQMRSFLEACCGRQGIVPLSLSQKAGLPVWLADLTLLAAVQRKFDAKPLSFLAKRALPLLETELRQWRSKTSRARRRVRLGKAAEDGNLGVFLAVVNDPTGLRLDHRQAQEAEAEISNLMRVMDEAPERRAANDREARNSGEFFSLLTGIAVAMASVWLEFCR